MAAWRAAVKEISRGGTGWPARRPVFQRPERGVMHRAPLCSDLPVPFYLRFCDRHLAEHDRAARADLVRAPHDQRGPVTIAISLPFFNGDAASSSGAAIIIINRPAAWNDHTAQPAAGSALNRFASRPLTLRRSALPRPATQPTLQTILNC